MPTPSDFSAAVKTMLDAHPRNSRKADHLESWLSDNGIDCSACSLVGDSADKQVGNRIMERVRERRPVLMFVYREPRIAEALERKLISDLTSSASYPEFESALLVKTNADGSASAVTHVLTARDGTAENFFIRMFPEAGAQRVLLGSAASIAPSPNAEEADAVNEGTGGEVLDSLEKSLARSLLQCKNMILHGPPGTGKTFLATRIARHAVALGAPHPDAIEEVQFHQSYSYDDFVQGFRPMEDGSIRLLPGLFLDITARSLQSPATNFVLVIDEINRGNVSQIFGELLSLIEIDKRRAECGRRLLHSPPGASQFFVPGNLLILGMMNTADRSLALVDFALRRRFQFVAIEPMFDQVFVQLAVRHGLPQALAQGIAAKMLPVNEAIASDRRFLGPGHQIGHAYFLPATRPADPTAWVRTVLVSQIGPLLEEYWHDRPEIAKQHLESLLA